MTDDKNKQEEAGKTGKEGKEAKRDTGKLTRITQAEVDAIVHKHESYSLGRMGGVRANFAYHDLSGLNLSKKNLCDADFTGASLYETDFQNSKLERALFFCADMRYANLYGASLLRADMRGAAIRGANLAGANMTGVDLRDGSLANAAADGDLNKAHKNLTTVDKGGANLSGANLSGSKLAGAVAINSDFSDATLKSTKFNTASLKGANFSGANLEGADLSDCDLEGVNLRNSILTNTAINLSEVAAENREGALTSMPMGLSVHDLPMPIEELLKTHEMWLDSNGQKGKQLDISKYDLRSGVIFTRLRLTMVRAKGTILYGINFTESQLQAVEMQDADLRQ